MYTPSLQYSLVHAHIQDLHRSAQTRSRQSITAMGRTAIRKRRRLQLSIYLARASEHFAGQSAPEAYAF